LLCHLRKARFIHGKALFPAFFLQFFLSSHTINYEQWTMNYEPLTSDN
jgi:hypothetical protein